MAAGLQNVTIHTHLEHKQRVTGRLLCRISYEQFIEGTVADYLYQTAQPDESLRVRQLKRNALTDGLQSGFFTFIPRSVSQAAACDDLIYTINFDRHNLDIQGFTFPLFEDQN